jgi:transposase
MKPLSGNASDSGSFPDLIDRHVEHLQNAHGFDYVVAGSSLYSADHVGKLTESGVKFVTRVPEAISEAKTRIQEAEIESMRPLTEGYRGEECRSEYGGVGQRWLVVHSEKAEERAKEHAREKVQKEHEEEQDAFSDLTEREFAAAKTPSRRSKSSKRTSRRANLPVSRSPAPLTTLLRSPPRPVEKETGSKRPVR